MFLGTVQGKKYSAHAIDNREWDIQSSLTSSTYFVAVAASTVSSIQIQTSRYISGRLYEQGSPTRIDCQSCEHALYHRIPER